MTADFYPLDEICPLNAGFYFYASGARNAMDGIKGYNLQVEKAVNSSYFYLKLHYFNQAWYGSKAEAYLKINKLPITVTLVADQGRIEAYVDGYTDAVLTYDIGDGMWSSASVGFRTMCECGAKIGNFSITTDKLDADTTELTKLLETARSVDLNNVVESSKTAIIEAITQAQTALESNTQAIVDKAVAVLKVALENKKDKFSYDDFSAAMTQATEIVLNGEGFYTENTFNSLKLAISRSVGLTVESSEDEISEATTLIRSRIANLTSYYVKN